MNVIDYTRYRKTCNFCHSTNYFNFQEYKLYFDSNPASCWILTNRVEYYK